MRLTPRRLVFSLACVALIGSGCSGSSDSARQDEPLTEEVPAAEAEQDEAPAAEPAATEQEPEPAQAAKPDLDNADLDELFTVMGQVDKEQVRGVIGQYKPSIYECYKTEITNNPGVNGRVLLSITSNGSGDVASAIISQSTIKARSLEGCITNAVRKWKMPQSRDGGLVMIKYPIVLPP